MPLNPWQISRRFFFKITAFFLGTALLPGSNKVQANNFINNANAKRNSKEIFNNSLPLGIDDDGMSRVYISKGRAPEDNLKHILSEMGGINKFISKEDIVILKPNAQWWWQGMTNTDAMKEFIELILKIPGFSGEIIIAENHQIQEDNSRGWTTEKRNGTFNLNELIQYFRNKGHANITKYHWHNAGKCSTPLQHDACCGKRVDKPEDGDGYVWMEDSYYLSPEGRKCVTTYPVFTSKYSGITIDLKNGPWQNGKYLDRRIRFINFSALNHHSRYGGVTASVKNLMGVVDMTCGFPGDKPEGCYNVHHIGVNENIKWLKKKIHWRLAKIRDRHRLSLEEFWCKKFHYAGGALGTLMRDVRMPDLNIITAEYVGWGHRTNDQKMTQTKAIAASTDPVALDYIAAKRILFPVTPADEADEEGKLYIEMNNPDDKNGPFYKFLLETNKQGIGNLNPVKIKVKEFDSLSKV